MHQHSLAWDGDLAITDSGVLASASPLDFLSANRFLCTMIIAGTLNATIVSLVLCRVLASHIPTVFGAFSRAFLFVTLSFVAGAAGSWFYWKRAITRLQSDPPVSFASFVLINSVCWLWTPAAILLSPQGSSATAFIVAICTVVFAAELHAAVPEPPHAFRREEELFATSLRDDRVELNGYVIALNLYLTGYFFIRHNFLNATAPLSIAVFLLSWKLSPDRFAAKQILFAGAPDALWKVAKRALSAVVITAVILLLGTGNRFRTDVIGNSDGNASATRSTSKSAAAVLVPDIFGYQSIILWPVPRKPQLIIPNLSTVSPFGDRSAKPLVIRFDGPYWYFQPPQQKPGERAHQAQGSPLNVNIEANNFRPLNMSAVQNLSFPIRSSRCREIEVSIENKDNVRGEIELDVRLTDTLAAGRPTLALGRLPILSSEPGQFTTKSAPLYETMRFPIPVRSSLRKFDQITVDILPGTEHALLGSKIAIQQFQLDPR